VGGVCLCQLVACVSVAIELPSATFCYSILLEKQAMRAINIYNIFPFAGLHKLKPPGHISEWLAVAVVLLVALLVLA